VDLYDGNFHVIDVYRSMSTSINTSAIAVRVDGHLVEWNDGIHRYAGGTKQLTNIGFVIDGASNGQFRTRVNGADYHIRFGAYGWLHPNVYPKGISTLDLDYVTIRTANLFDPNRPIVWP
jgi:hypothetical protein